MIRHRIHAPIAAAVAAGGLFAAVASPAMADVLPADINANPRGGALEYGTSTWKLSSGAASKLKSAGVTLKGLGSGDTGTDVKGSKIAFQAEPKGSIFDPTTMKGVVVTSGGLSVKGKSKTAKLTAITLEPGIEKIVTAKLGKKLIELGSLKGGKAVFSHQADGALTGAKLSLSAGGAKKLNSAVGGGFKSGSFATVAISGTSRELPLASGVAKMTLDQGLVNLITSSGAAITVTAPVTREGNTITIPLTAGAFDPENLTGRLSLEGNVTVGKPGLSVTLFGWRVAIGGTQHQLFANINDAVAAPIADVDVSTLNAGTNADGTFYATGGKLTVSKIASQVLTQNFGINEPAGTPMGTVDLSGTLSGRQ